MRLIGSYLFTLVLFHCACPLLTAQEYSWQNYSIADGLPQTQVISMMQDSEGFLWLGTKNGFSIFDGIEFENYSTKDGLAFDHIRVIQEYKPGVVYIGSWGGLNLMENREISTIAGDLPDSYIFMCIDYEGNLWFSERSEGLMMWKDG